jgi:hypothetical protein
MAPGRSLQKLQIDHLAGQPQSIKSSKLDESAIRFSDCKLGWQLQQGIGTGPLE